MVVKKLLYILSAIRLNCTCCRFIPESIRWQIVNGKPEQAKATIMNIAKTNKRKVDEQQLKEDIVRYCASAIVIISSSVQACFSFGIV